jgi:DNA polymerase-1
VVVSLPNSKTNVNEEYFPEDVQRKLGVLPGQVVDYKALVGDPSDNIPGVKGIGEKTAVSLLAQYETLDNIYGHLDEISGRAGTALAAGRENAYLSQDLARIRTDLKLRFDLTQAEIGRFNPAAVEDIFRQLEFRTSLSGFTISSRSCTPAWRAPHSKVCSQRLPSRLWN